MLDTADVHAHGAQDLDVGHGIEVESFREFFDDKLLNHSFCLFGSWCIEKEEFALDVAHLFS